MIDMELAAPARRVVEEASGVTADEEVLVLADPGSVAVGRALTLAARATGATASLLVIPRLETHGAEPPAAAAAAMRSADAVFAANEHSLSHTTARKRATAEGSRVAILRGVDEEMFVDGAMTAEFEAVADLTGAVCDALSAADRAHVTTPSGTDVEMSLAGRSALPLDGYFHEGVGFSNFPPGLAVTSPVEGTADGPVVMDFSADELGRLDDPVRLTVADGAVASVDGGRQATRLRELLDDADENAGTLAEFAIGTNPAARLVGNLAEDKKRRGVVDFALGDNTSIGGRTESGLHLDFVALDATIALDDTVVQEAGELDPEALSRVG